MDFQAESGSKFFKRRKAGILFYAQLVKLIQLISDAALLGSLFLRPATLLSELKEAFSKQLRSRLFHSCQVGGLSLTGTLSKGSCLTRVSTHPNGNGKIVRVDPGG